MQIVLPRGSWRTFQLVLLREECATGWDPNINQKIFMILQGEEIGERFLSAFPPLRSDEKLDLSLDDIINPIEILEKKSHRKGCHPGRLTLDPERYNRAWDNDRHVDHGWHPRWGGGTPPHMRAGFLATPWGKHRLLDVSENIENPHRRALAKDVYQQRHLSWGLQDMYFLGGLPLEYWCNGDSMGMMVPQSPPCSDTYQWPGTAFRAQTDEEAGDDGDFSCVTECGRTYCFSRMFYLPCERVWWTRCGVGEFLEIHERNPLTWHGNQDWIGDNRPSGPDTSNLLFSHNVYIKYIQKIEDFDEAFKCEAGRRGWQFDEYCSWLSQFSDIPLCITIRG